MCAAKGLTGRHGVLIPAANARDLMLRPDVVKACSEGKFSVWAVSDITEALELMTGMEPGVLGADGKYPESSLLGLAMARARRFWQELSAKAEAAARLAEDH